jgi:hypothetical protein
MSSHSLDESKFPFTGLPVGVVERLAAAQAEAERLEKARIDTEGDGSEDDLECQAKKFKPSTAAYKRCLTMVAARKVQEAAAEEKRLNEKAERDRKRIAAENDAEDKKQRAAMARADAENRRNAKEANRAVVPEGFSAAHSKCIGLGFKPKTEGYGKCVLQLSR